MEVATARHNTGWVSYLRGDLPQALEAYADAGAQFDALGITSVDLVLDQATSYLAGGLADDALAVAEQALAARPLLARERADLLVSVAESALAARDWARAASAADEGAALMRAQSRHVPSLEADLFAIAARIEQGQPAGPLLRRAERLVHRMREASMPQLAQALLLGARLARDVRSARAAALADQWLEEASASRHARTHAVRALGWLALAQRRDAAGDAGGVLRACDRGLRALDEHQATLGSQELRAVMSGHGAALAELGTRTALASGNSRRLLQWSERWRANALVVPSSTTAHDPEIVADLAALRAQRNALAAARTQEERTRPAAGARHPSRAVGAPAAAARARHG